MSLTNRYYGGSSLGGGHTIQDFGLCDLGGNYVYTAKTRTKGLLVVVFFTPDAAASSRVLNTVRNWIEELGTDKWTALAVAGPDRPTLSAYAQAQDITGVSIVVDHNLYQTRTWGISELPTTLLIEGKTGQVIAKAVGNLPVDLEAVKQTLGTAIAKIRAAEEAAKKADEEKKAAEAPAKPSEPAKV